MRHGRDPGNPRKPGGRSRVACLILALTAPWVSMPIAADCDRDLSHYRIQIWRTTEGLPLDTVTALAQTAEGFLWVGTEDGLARFDGASFQRAPVAEVIGDAPETMDALTVDAAGNLLGGTSAAGIVELASPGRSPVLIWVSDHGVTDLLAEATGRIWAGTRGRGLLRREHADAPLMQMPESEGATVRALASRRAGGVWVGHEGDGLQWFDGDRFRRPMDDERLERLFVGALLERADGSVWIAAREGLYRMHDGHLEDLSTQFGVTTDAHANALLEDDSGAIWIGTAGAGVIRVCGGRIERLTVADGLSSGSVLALFQDRERSIWLGTGGGGLVQLALTPILGIKERDGLPAAPVLPVMEHSDGAMWIGTFGGGVVRMMDGVAEPVDGLNSDRVLSLAEGPEGETWIGTRDGLNRRDRDGGVRQFGRDDGLKHPSVAALLHDGETLWIGTLGGLLAYGEGRFEDILPESGDAIGHVVNLFRDREARLWVATDGDGLYLLEDGVLRSPPFASEMPSRVVLGTMETPTGALWFHTARGLLRWDGEQVGLVSSRHGLPDPQIFSMLDDGRGGIWMSGNRGVFRVAAAELDAVASGHMDDIEAETFGARDGMPSSETNGGFQPAAWRSRSGELWYPTMAGVAVIDPARLGVERPPPNVLVDRVVAGGQRLPDLSLREVGPRPDWIEFTYAAPTFRRPGHLLFEHRLRGFDDAWYATRDRTALFRKPPPGRYTFEVRVRRSGGTWSEPAAAEVVIRRHLLEQPLLWLALLLAVGAAGALAARRVSRLRARRQEQMERAQRMEAVGLLAGGVAHDFNNILTAIMSGTDVLMEELPADSPLREDAGMVMDAAARGAGLTRQLLTFARRQPVHPRWIDIAAEVRAMEPFLRSMLPKQVRLTFDVVPDVGRCFIDPVQLQQVVLNLVVNGRDAMRDGGELRLKLWKESQRADASSAVLVVTDSGTGIDPAVRQRIFEPLFTTKAEGTGLGLAVSAGIVQQANGRISVDSPSGQGATFRVELPVVDRPPGSP